MRNSIMLGLPILAAVSSGFVDVADANPPTLDLNNPPRLGTEYYPTESNRLHEWGTCKIKAFVAADGTIRNINLTRSTGFPRLDEACLDAFAHGGLLPATVDGKPIDASFEMPITWGEPQKPFPNMDPKNPAHIGEAYYPAESARLHEEGTCKVSVTVKADGKIRRIKLTESSGYPRLDKACSDAFAHGGLLPATVDGKPIDMTVEIPISWVLTTET